MRSRRHDSAMASMSMRSLPDRDCVDCVTPRDVLDLAARQVEIRCKRYGILVGQPMKHALPYLRPCLGCGLVKPDLVQKWRSNALSRFVVRFVVAIMMPSIDSIS